MAPPCRLTHKQKWIICQFKADNPSMSQVALVSHFNTKWGKSMSASTMSNILKNKKKWVVPESNMSTNELSLLSQRRSLFATELLATKNLLSDKKWLAYEPSSVNSIPTEASFSVGSKSGSDEILPENRSSPESTTSPGVKSKPSGSNSSMPSILTQQAELRYRNRRREKFATELAATKKMLEKYDAKYESSSTVPLMLDHDSICEDCSDTSWIDCITTHYDDPYHKDPLRTIIDRMHDVHDDFVSGEDDEEYDSYIPDKIWDLIQQAQKQAEYYYNPNWGHSHASAVISGNWGRSRHRTVPMSIIRDKLCDILKATRGKKKYDYIAKSVSVFIQQAK